MESRYLYHPENRNDYYQSLLQEENCLHGRNLGALMDADKEDSRYDFLRTHVTNCPKCKKQFENKLLERKSFDLLIPNISASKEASLEMNLELDDFVSTIEQAIIREKKNLKRKRFHNIKATFKSFGQNLFSFSTVKGLTFAAISFVILKAVL